MGEIKEIIVNYINQEQYKDEAVKALLIIEERLTEIGIKISEQKGRKIYNQITKRIKSADSILKKMDKKKYPKTMEGIHSCNDLLGIRIICLFVDDVYDVVSALSNQPDLKIVKTKDYIRKPKSNGYMSYHMLIGVPVFTTKKDKVSWCKVEVQIRTVAMDFWSVLDHQLLYKKEFPGAEPITRELKEYATTIAMLDKNMLKLRLKIDNINEG